MILYHGSNSKFDTFRNDIKYGNSTYIWFSDNKELCKDYADEEESYIYTVDANLSNALDLRGCNLSDRIIGYKDGKYYGTKNLNNFCNIIGKTSKEVFEYSKIIVNKYRNEGLSLKELYLFDIIKVPESYEFLNKAPSLLCKDRLGDGTEINTFGIYSLSDIKIIKTEKTGELLDENLRLNTNEFFHCSGNPNLKVQDITEGLEGFHITKDLDSALSRVSIKNYSDSYMYKISVKSDLKPLEFTMDIFRWNSCTLARFILAAINNSVIGGGFDYDYNDNKVDISNYIKDTQKLLPLTKYKDTLEKIMVSHESIQNLKIIFSMLKSIGYNSIKYINQFEGDTDSTAYILFGNELIKSVENLNTTDKALLEELSSFFKDLPKYFYHATYKPFLKSILEKGLGNTRRKMWSDSKGKGTVYLSLAPEVAYSYAESAEWLDEVEDYDKYADNIIVLKIDSSKLDKDKVFVDENVLDNDGSTVEYYGIINRDAIVNIVDEQGKSLVLNKKLTEDTRTQLTSKSRNADQYKNNVRGKNRFERKKYSKVENSVQKFNTINMNDFFKKDLLTVNIPVVGETDKYEVTLQMDGVVAEIARNIKSNQNKFEYRTVIQALTKIFNTTNIKVHCTCDDFKYRYQHQLIVNNDNTDGSDKDPGPGKTGMANTQGKGCKHVLLCLANQDWIMKVASVIKNYITYMDVNKHQLFMKAIFPKLYNSDAENAAENNLVGDDTNLETEKSAIEAINEWAKNRGKIKAGTNVNPVTGTGGKTKKPENKETEGENK